MKLLVQGDDYGFTRGVTYGVIDAIERGILTCSGMFTNMEIAPWAAEFIKERPNFCFGVDFNLVSGPSCADPKKIPHLVDTDGRFINSKIRKSDERWQSEEGQMEMFPYDEVYTEYMAQFDRFVALTGRLPGYLHGHSIMTKNMLKAMHVIAAEKGVPTSFDYLKYLFTTLNLPQEDTDNVSKTKTFHMEAQLKKDPLKAFMKHQEEYLKHEYVMIGGHPGYVDADLFQLTSLSIERCKDLMFLTSPEMKAFIKDHAVELIDYRDLVQTFGIPSQTDFENLGLERIS